jgi:cell division protein FtsI/penicillin-binding protein 2
VIRAVLLGFIATASAWATDPALVRRVDAVIPNDDTQYVVVDASGAVMADRWADREHAVPMASLIKPFTAIAYGFAHQYQYPEVDCRHCWREQGHGRIGIVDAIAQSCNSYFEQIAQDLDPRHVWGRYGLEPPYPLSARALAGEAGIWRTDPVTLLRAYLELSRRRGEPGVTEVVRGLLRSARSGTASAVGAAVGPALAKTGTRPCTHARHAPGDGLTVALYPADSPRYAVIVCRHGVPGFITAATAGRILQALTRPD